MENEEVRQGQNDIQFVQRVGNSLASLSFQIKKACAQRFSANLSA